MLKKNQIQYYLAIALMATAALFPLIAVFFPHSQFVNNDIYMAVLSVSGIMGITGGYFLGQHHFQKVIKNTYEIDDFSDGTKFTVLSLNTELTETPAGEYAKVQAEKRGETIDCTLHLKKPNALVNMVYFKIQGRLFVE